MKSLFFLAFILMTKTGWAAGNWYDLSHVVNVEIKMQDWETLRNLEPNGGICHFGYIGSRYAWYPAEEVRVDGQAFANVSIKKRSWCGSFSKEKPALNIKLDKANSLTLNNAIQDPSYVRQCLAYQIFAAAGVPAPLCNFARVWANGQDLGVYVNIQPIKKAFFEQHFGKPAGNNYEFEITDFREDQLDVFANGLDAMNDDTSLSDMRSFISSLNQADQGNWEPMLQQLDQEAFLRYWAAEILLVHWDGLALTSNNAFGYFHSDGRLRFIPWGTDQVLQRTGWDAYNDLRSNRLAAKLYESEYHRNTMHEHVKTALRTYWNEPELIAKVDEMADRVQWQLPEWQRNALWSAVWQLRQNIQIRRGQLESYIP